MLLIDWKFNKSGLSRAVISGFSNYSFRWILTLSIRFGLLYLGHTIRLVKWGHLQEKYWTLIIWRGFSNVYEVSMGIEWCFETFSTNQQLTLVVEGSQHWIDLKDRKECRSNIFTRLCALVLNLLFGTPQIEYSKIFYEALYLLRTMSWVLWGDIFTRCTRCSQTLFLCQWDKLT